MMLCGYERDGEHDQVHEQVDDVADDQASGQQAQDRPVEAALLVDEAPLPDDQAHHGDEQDSRGEAAEVARSEDGAYPAVLAERDAAMLPLEERALHEEGHEVGDDRAAEHADAALAGDVLPRREVRRHARDLLQLKPHDDVQEAAVQRAAQALREVERQLRAGRRLVDELGAVGVKR